MHQSKQIRFKRILPLKTKYQTFRSQSLFRKTHFSGYPFWISERRKFLILLRMISNMFLSIKTLINLFIFSSYLQIAYCLSDVAKLQTREKHSFSQFQQNFKASKDNETCQMIPFGD